MHLHAPHPEVVIVRVRGTLDETGAALVATRVGQQLGRVLHVVLDLGQVRMRRAGVDVLLELDRAATARGTQLHITGGEQAACARVLQRLHHDGLLHLAASADAVIASLPQL
jgi:anti-anti-sigma regulatory factor